jgi:GT2 family glycosyltransferase
MAPDSLPLTVAVPTYRREAVLLETLDALLGLEPPAAELLVLDQSERHDDATSGRLRELDDTGLVRWLLLPEPSIPRAMNRGLSAASQRVVLFVDDDVLPEADLLSAHLEAHRRHGDVLVAGRVIQPWQEGQDLTGEGEFHFASTRPAWVAEFMGGNFSVGRDAALALGGFDENFVRVAYRFEAEFARRFLASGRRIRFEPKACLHHLKAGEGGTRTYGEHLTTWRPDHAVGAYYYGLRTGALGEVLKRPLRAVATRHHLRRPWWIPVTLIAEVWGFVWAVWLFIRGPGYAAGPNER